MVVLLGVPVGLPAMGVGGVSNSFACSWDTFPLAGLPHPAVI